MALKEIAKRLNVFEYDQSKLWDGVLVYLSRSDTNLKSIMDTLHMDGILSARISPEKNKNFQFELTIDNPGEIERLKAAGAKAAEELIKNKEINLAFDDLDQFDWYPLGHGKMQLVARHIASGTGYVRNRLAKLGIDEGHVITVNGNTVVTEQGCKGLAELGYFPASNALAHPNPKAPMDHKLANALRIVGDTIWYKAGGNYVLNYTFQSEATAKIFAGHLENAGADEVHCTKLGGEWSLHVNAEDAIKLAYNGVKNLSYHFPKMRPDQVSKGHSII